MEKKIPSQIIETPENSDLIAEAIDLFEDFVDTSEPTVADIVDMMESLRPELEQMDVHILQDMDDILSYDSAESEDDLDSYGSESDAGGVNELVLSNMIDFTRGVLWLLYGPTQRVFLAKNLLRRSYTLDCEDLLAHVKYANDELGRLIRKEIPPVLRGYHAGGRRAVFVESVGQILDEVRELERSGLIEGLGHIRRLGITSNPYYDDNLLREIMKFRP